MRSMVEGLAPGRRRTDRLTILLTLYAKRYKLTEEARMREVRWLGSSRDDLMAMPREVVLEFGHALYVAQMGEHPEGAKPLTGFGPAVVELIERHDAIPTGRSTRCAMPM